MKSNDQVKFEAETCRFLAFVVGAPARKTLFEGWQLFEQNNQSPKQPKYKNFWDFWLTKKAKIPYYLTYV